MSDPTNPNVPPSPAPPEASAQPGVTERPTGAVITDPGAVRQAELEAQVAQLQAQLADAERRPVVDVVQDDDFELVDVGPGDWVTVIHRDPHEGAPVDVEQVGQVVRVVEVGSGPAAVVAWVAGGLSDPIPLDHRVHGRVDGPRVETVGA